MIYAQTVSYGPAALVIVLATLYQLFNGVRSHLSNCWEHFEIEVVQSIGVCSQ